MNDIVLVEIVDGAQDLLNGLGGVLLGELALLANSVEQLSTGGKFCDDIVLVLQEDQSQRLDLCAQSRCCLGGTHSRLEPVNELDDVRVLETLEHIQLVEDHALVAPHVLLQDDLDSNPAIRALGLPDDAIGARA